MPTQPRYIVEVRYRRGNYLAEVDLDRTDRATVLTDLLAGQYQGAARVYRLEDATGEFVRALFQHCVDEGEDVPLWLSDLIENANEPACPRCPPVLDHRQRTHARSDGGLDLYGVQAPDICSPEVRPVATSRLATRKRFSDDLT